MPRLGRCDEESSDITPVGPGPGRVGEHRDVLGRARAHHRRLSLARLRASTVSTPSDNIFLVSRRLSVMTLIDLDVVTCQTVELTSWSLLMRQTQQSDH